MKRAAPLLVFALLAAACSESKTRATRLQSFKVTLKSPGASADAPFPHSATPVDFVVDIEALDTRGERIEGYDGVVQVGVVPGEVAGVNPTNPVRLSNGLIENVRISIRRSAGDTRITAETRGCAASGDLCAELANSQAVGASSPIYFHNPRIRDIQEAPGNGNSPFNFAIVTVDRGRNIVAHVSNSGFSVVDRDDNAYNSIFAYNFSRPNEIRRGDRLRSFSGQVVEFLGYTELGFPLWDIDFRCPNADEPDKVCDAGEFCVNGACRAQECPDRICAEGSVCDNNRCVPNQSIPDPVPIDDLLGNNRELEKYEGGLVSLRNVVTTQEFIDCDSPVQNPGANGDGVCQFCRSCRNNRDINGACPAGGGCCPINQVCNTPLSECTSTCDSDRGEDGLCPTGKNCCTDGACNLSLGAMLFPGKNLGICGGCTVAEKAEALCEAQCSTRRPPQKLCTNACDYRDFNQYNGGITDEDGNWTGQTVLLNTRDTLSNFRPDAAENLGRRFSLIKGILSNIFAPTAFWILTPRDECDVGGLSDAERRRTDCDTVK